MARSSPKRLPKNRLKVERELRGWSQGQLAARLGVTQPMVSEWEQGKRKPGPYNCQQLSEIFKKSIEELGLFSATSEEIDEQFDTSSEREQAISEEPLALPLPAREQPAHFYRYVTYPRDPFFTGRESILEDIHRKLNTDATTIAIVALNGLAGLGKTHTAIEYTYRFREEYHSIFWISADNLLQEMRRLASVLNLREAQESDSSLVLYAVKSWFHQHTNWLIVFDNVEDMKSLYDVLPQSGRGHILLTTTLPAAGFLTQCIEIPPLSLQEGATFLLRRAKHIKAGTMLEDVEQEHQKQAIVIAEEMDGLSLALDQAAAYIEETQCDIGEYLERYRSRRAVFLDRRGWSSTTHHLSLAATLSLSFEKVERISSAAVEFLRLCAFLYAQDIPEEMITEAASILEPPLSTVATDPHLFEEVVGALRRFSLLRRQRETKILSLHRLVQVILKEGMNEQLQRYWAEQCVRMVSSILPPLDFVHWHRLQRYITQAQSCLSLIDEYQMRSQEAAQLLLRVGEYRGETSPKSEYDRLLRQAVDLTQELELDHPVRLASMNALAICYFNRGRYQDAEPLLEEVIEQSQEDISLNKATCLNNLGEVYFMQRRYEEAESLFFQAITMRKRLAGAEDPVVATSLRCLAQLYAVQERYEKAKPLFEQALKIRESTLGNGHLAVADSLEGLAELYARQHLPEKAGPFYQKAAEIYKKEYGSTHARLVNCLTGLAETYLAQEQFEEAESLLLEVMAIYDQDEEQANPDKAQALRDLAFLYVYHQERFMEAEALFLEAAAIRSETVGDHPYTALSYLDLGRFYAWSNNYPKAEPYYKQALRVYAQTNGLEDALGQHIVQEYQMLLSGMEERYLYFTDYWFLSNLVRDYYRRLGFLPGKIREKHDEGGEMKK
jgi:tetratricopeptide (TPR) repeat protein